MHNLPSSFIVICLAACLIAPACEETSDNVPSDQQVSTVTAANMPPEVDFDKTKHKSPYSHCNVQWLKIHDEFVRSLTCTCHDGQIVNMGRADLVFGDVPVGFLEKPCGDQMLVTRHRDLRQGNVYVISLTSPVSVSLLVDLETAWYRNLPDDEQQLENAGYHAITRDGCRVAYWPGRQEEHFDPVLHELYLTELPSLETTSLLAPRHQRFCWDFKQFQRGTYFGWDDVGRELVVGLTDNAFECTALRLLIP